MKLKELQSVLIGATKQPRETILESIKAPLPRDAQSLVDKPPETVDEKDGKRENEKKDEPG